MIHCNCVCARARPCTFDWRHATAGSNYKDMKQIVKDYRLAQSSGTVMWVNIHKNVMDWVV